MLQNGQRGVVRRLREDYQLTNLGRLFKNKYSQHVAHIPDAGRAYERRDWLPANVLGGEASRQPDRLSEQQILQNVKRETLRLVVGGRGPRRRQGAHHGTQRRDVLLRPEGEWVVSSETTQYRNSRVHVEPSCGRGCEACAACRTSCRASTVSWNAQLAQLLGVPFEEVCGDFDALAKHDWRAHGISPVEIRAVCTWRNAPMVLISNTGEPLDRFEPAQRETKTVVFTYYDGHAFFYRNARPVLEQMGCAARWSCTGATRSRPCRRWRTGARGRARSSQVTSTRRTYGRRGGSCCSRSTTRRSRSARLRSSRA